MFTNWAIDRGPHFVYFWGPPGPVALGSTLTASLQWFASLWSHLPFVPGRFLAWTKLLDTQSVSECLGVWNISIGFYRYLMIYWIYCTVHVYLYLYIYSLGHVPIPNMPAFVYSPTPRRVRRLFLADTSQLKRLKMWKLDQTRMCSSSLMYTL